MKTFKGIFTKTVPSVEDLETKLQYTFNTDYSIKNNTFVYSSKYGKPIYVIEVLEKEYKYWDRRKKIVSNKESRDCIPLAVLDDIAELSINEIEGIKDPLQF